MVRKYHGPLQPGKRSAYVPKKRTRKGIQKIARTEALKVVKQQSEIKQSMFHAENQQLYHMMPYFHNNALYTTHGTDSGDRPGNWTNRIGDELYLKSLNMKFQLYNKQDRPNVHYRIIVFWYESGSTPTVSDVLDNQGNLLLNQPNRETVSVIHDKIYPGVYPAPHGSEFSRVISINKRWKNKKIVYNDSQATNSAQPKMKDLAWFVLATDVYGTLETDNIASFAVQYAVKFQEN